MPSIDERVVSMAFDNAKFEAGVAVTMASLAKLEASLAKVGSTNSLGDIEKAGNKVTLETPMSAVDKLRAKFSRGVGAESIQDIEKAGNKVTLEQPTKAVDNLQNKLDKGIDARAISDIEKAGDQVSLSGVSKAINTVSGQFSVLQGAAAVALGGITANAVSKGASWAKSFGVGPIMAGLHEYETNLKAIQTVQANTDQPLTKINKSLQELNTYSDQTIYNFGEMAKNIGTFTAAGVDLKTATSSIKGIANMAALSGSSSQQAATAMYQLSQAISSGRVGLQDWNSVVNAGMGGKKLQNALAQTAIAMGGINGAAVKLEGPMKKLTINGKSFRESISGNSGDKPWLSSEVLVNTLATLDGRFSKAALSAELTKNGLKKYTAAQIEASIADSRAALEKKNGVKYTDAQFKALMHLSDSAFKSATEVKTLGQVFDVAKETIGSGWSASFQNIFGNLKEAKTLFTGMSGVINGFINKTSLARNELLSGWKEMGGRADVIQGIKNVFNLLFDVLGKVGHAFREIFPRKTSQDLADVSRSFLIFTAHLNNSPQIIANIARTFKGFFAVLHIGWEIVKGLAGVIFDLLGVVGKGSGGFLSFTGSVGDFLVAVDAALTKGGLLNTFFKTLTAILTTPLKMISGISSAFMSLFSSGDKAKSFGDQLGALMGTTPGKLGPLQKVIEGLTLAWGKFEKMLESVWVALKPWFTKIADSVSQIGSVIGDAITNANFDNVMSAIQTTFLGGIFLQIKKLITKGVGVDLSGGLLKNLGDSLGALTSHLQTMQQGVKASIILKIAAALALLAASAFVLSTIEPKRLASAMSAMAIGLGQLVGAMALLTKVGGKASIAIVPAIGAGMILLAGAVLILAAAVKVFSTLSWEGLVKGLIGVGGALGAVGVGMKFLGPSTLVQAAPLLAIGVALNLLAVAVKQFADLSWEDLAKGLIGVGASLVIIGGAMMLFGPSILLVGPGLILVSFAMSMLAGAVAAFGNLDTKTLFKGIYGLAMALAALAASLFLFPPTVALQGAGLILVAAGLATLGGALKVIGSMSLWTLVKGLTAMGIALGLLSVGLFLMVGSLPGAVSLLAAAAAFAILAPAMALMGNLDWSTILKALATMALTLGVLALVGSVVAIPLIVLGAALTVLGVGLLVVASAFYVFSKALALLSDTGQKGIAVIIAAITGFIAVLPKIVIDFVKGLTDILLILVSLLPKVLAAVGKMLTMIIAFVTAQAPKLAVAVGVLIASFLTVIDNNSPNIIASGIKLLLNFMTGIAKNVGQLVATGTQIVTRFLDGLTRDAPRIINSGAKMLMAFANGIATKIPLVVAKVADMITRFLNAVTVRIPGIVAAGAKLIISFLFGIGQNLPKIVAAGASLLGKYMVGIGKAIPELVQKGLFVARKFLNGLADGMSGLADAGFKAIIRFLNGIEKSIRDNFDDLVQAGRGICDAIVDGLVDQFGKAGPAMRKALESAFKILPGWAKKLLGIKSPSTVFAEIGKQTMAGFIGGMVGQGAPMLVSAKNVIVPLVETFKRVPKVIREIGREVGKGFKQGLDGSAEEIISSFRTLNDRLQSEMKAARAGIKEERKKLEDLEQQHADKLAEIRKLKSKKKPDEDAIKTATDELKDIRGEINVSTRAITKYQNVLSGVSDAHSDLVGGLQVEKARLVSLSKDLDVVIAVLDEANKELERLTQEREDFAKSTTDSFSKLPDIDKEAKDPVADYKQKLIQQIAATKKFYETMKALREKGLDDVTFKKLLSEGLGSADFAEALLRSGDGGIQSLNQLDSELLSISTELGNNVAGSLYDAGVKSAQGFVDGLIAKKAEIEAAMSIIADAVVKRIKMALGITSPSKVFAEIGRFLMTGFANGIDKGADAVDSSITSAAQRAVDAAKAAFDAMPIDGLMEIDPVITPVLDLSVVEKEAGKLSDLTNVTPITAAASYGQASAISEAASATAEEAAAVTAGETKVFKLEQNNYSPEALSEVEIYRQTNNQFAQLKSALNLP